MTDPLAVLQRLRESRPREASQPGERCDLCAEPIADEHGHLVDLEARRLLCACRGCYLLFTPEGAGGDHYRSVPDRYLAFPRRALLDRIGMRSTFPETDAFGNFVLSSQVYTTARDLARLGLLYLHDGVWQGDRILPAGWVEYTREPAPARKPEDERDWGYGKQFWLFDRDPRVPRDTYSTAGHRGQHATIVPSRT